MKKIIAIIVGLLFLCSCTITVATDEKSKNSIQVQKECELVELEFDGHKHEFVVYDQIFGYSGGIAHWPDCKYCKQQRW
jgi:hypothetical protein